MRCWYLDIHRPINNAPDFAIYHVLRHFPEVAVSASQSNHQNRRRYRHVNYAHKADTSAQAEHLLVFHKLNGHALATPNHFSTQKFCASLWQSALYFQHQIDCHVASNPSKFACNRLHLRWKNWLLMANFLIQVEVDSNQNCERLKPIILWLLLSIII